MTYVSKKEKVFDLPEQESKTSAISLQNAETRLKRFPSVSDRRAWTTEECQRYQHLYGLVNGSESSVSKSSSFKYIPFDVLLGILMAEKDAYIQELLDRQDDKSSSGGRANVLYKADGFEDSDDDRDALIRKDAEMVALKNKIAGLESELEDYRDTLTKAMHKLENMDDIMSENELLREKFKYSEQTVMCLHERKQELEKELQYFRRPSESGSDMDDKDFRWDAYREDGDRNHDEVSRISDERNILREQVKNLQKELEKNMAQMEMLRQVSQTTSLGLEEMSKENECYRRKLETMKYLEKHIEDLKKEAQSLTDKYKKESQKANDHLKQANLSARELQNLREERDRLQRRVEELAPFESQFISLQSKLHRVEMILDENEMLNNKLLQLNRLELENEHLKMKIDQMQGTEIQAAKDKEKIMQLQCEVVDQEEEIQRMLRQIEDLSEGYADRNEMHRLRSDLEEKNGKLKQYERQLTEIPILESEIEELRNKLQKCIDDFKTDKDLLQRLQEELEACRSRCHELEQMAPLHPSTPKTSKVSILEQEECYLDQLCQDAEVTVTYENKGENTDLVVSPKENWQTLNKTYAEKFTETMLGKTKTHSFEELRELEERNNSLKTEVEHLRSKLSDIDLDQFLQQTNEMKDLLRVRDGRIALLEEEIKDLKEEIQMHGNVEELRQHRDNLVDQVNNLKNLNEKFANEMKLLRDMADQTKELEKMLQLERKARDFTLNLLREIDEKLKDEKMRREQNETVTKLQKDEANLAMQQLYVTFTCEIDFWKSCKRLSDKVIKELRTENHMLREMKEYSDKVEIAALKAMIKKLRAKIRALKSITKPELQAEYESVQEKVRLLLMETDRLTSEISDLKVALDSEKKSKEFLEKELIGLQAEITACLTAGSQVLNQELAAKSTIIEDLRRELSIVQHNLENSMNEAQLLKEDNVALVKDRNNLKSEEEALRSEIRQLSEQIAEQRYLESEINRLSEQINKQNSMEEEYKRFRSQMVEQKPLENELSPTSDQVERKNFQREIRRLTKQIEDQKNIIIEQEDKEKSYLNEIIALKTNENEYKNDLFKFRTLEDQLLNRINNLEKELILKEEEITIIKQTCINLETEINRRQVDMDLLKCRLLEKVIDEEGPCSDTGNLETEQNEKYAAEEKCGLEEKHELEEAVRKIENKLDEFRTKLNERKNMEEEMTELRSKRDTLQNKISEFETEIEILKNKTTDFEKIKSELEQFKAKIAARGNGGCGEQEANDIPDLLRELDKNREAIEKLKIENENLKNQLSKAEEMLELSKKMQKTLPQNQTLTSSAGFYTPTAVLSPRSSFTCPAELEAVISVEAHQRELTNLENNFRLKIQKVKESNAKKVKKLTACHDRDATCRNKTFNDSLNNIKSNYENGIKKLVEKHKISISKLQELHEEEVDELNKNYETQMDAMEKQNENLLCDMQRESNEKCKNLTEQHNREIKALETRYELKLQEKDEQIQAERTKVETNVLKNASEVQEAHNLTKFYQSSILQMEEKHTKEMKMCKKNNVKQILWMKNKYEDLLVEEKKKFEEQLKEIMQQLNKGGVTRTADDSMMEKMGRANALVNSGCNINNKSRKSPSDVDLKFPEVVQKITNEGLESLTFEELILVHAKTCFLPESLTDYDERSGEEIGDGATEGCRHRALMTAEKEELLKRIFTLEREIVIKQLETHEAIVNMEVAEKYRIQELETALCNAQQKNSELQRHQVDMKIENYIMDRQASFNETSVMEKVKELERVKSEKKCLEEELQRERANVKNLTVVLDSEKERFKSQRKRDADYVQSIRLKLEEALNHEQMMESQLNFEAEFRAKFESELQSLEKNFRLITGLVLSPLETKAAKDLKNFDQCESTKEEIHRRSKSKQKSHPEAYKSL